MGNEFIVDPSYQGYVFVGCAEGRFQTDQGKMQDYANMYVLTPVSSWESEDYRASGMKADKKKCVSPAVWKDLVIGSKVNLYFDDRQRVIAAVPVE